MKKVAFICVHNSCRSQIAETLGKHQKSNKSRRCSFNEKFVWNRYGKDTTSKVDQ